MIGKYKTKVGISSIFNMDIQEGFLALVESGCDEIYTGYTPPYIYKNYPSVLNMTDRRGKYSGIDSFEKLKEVSGLALSTGLGFSIALNTYYVPEQYVGIERIIEEISNLKGVTSLIVSDLGLLSFLEKKRVEKKIHLSLRFPVFNSGTVGFIKGKFNIFIYK